MKIEEPLIIEMNGKKILLIPKGSFENLQELLHSTTIQHTVWADGHIPEDIFQLVSAHCNSMEFL